MSNVDKMFYINAECRRNKIQLTYAFDGEIKFAEIDNYQPVLYGRTFEDDPKFRELVSGNGLVPTKFKSIKEANAVIKAAHDDSSVEIYGNRNFAQTFVLENFGDCSTKYDKKLIHGAFLDIECPADFGFPHVEDAAWEINAHTVYHTGLGKYYIWGKHTFCVNFEIEKLLRNENISKDDIVYFQIDNEKDRLNHFLKWWRKNFPAYISGWNTSRFDLPYICHRLRNLGIDMNLLSPWKNVTVREGEYFGKPEFTVKIAGIADLDYLELYKKNRFITRESYKLDFIAYCELDRKKVDYSEIASNLRTLHKKDWDLYIGYNIIDVGLVKSLDDKLGFLDITFAVAYYANVNFGDVKSPVATWEAILYKELIKEGIILPNKQEHESASYEGGYVKDPQVGKHRWVLSFDLNSLYPHLIMQFNISPETITPIVVPDINVDTMTEALEYNKPKYDVAVCPSGYTFRKDFYGIAGRMMETLYKERKAIKKEMLVHEQDAIDIKGGHFDRAAMLSKYNMAANATDEELLSEAERMATLKDGGQMVRKILLNSFYGAMANIHFSCFDIRLAESITKSGQLAIRWVGRKVNEYLNNVLKTVEFKDFVVYTDTDSIYVCLDDVVDKMGLKYSKTDIVVDALDKFASQYIEKVIDAGYEDLKQYTNAYQQKMIMKREVISDNSIFVSKKRYAMSVWNSEGVAFDKPKIKVMGMDMVKSSTPQVVRDAMKDVVTLLLNGSEKDLHQYVDRFYQKFMIESPENIAFPRGVNKLEESYCRVDGTLRDDVTCPINSRAAIVYNNTLKKYNLDYEKIVNGDKIKYIHLELPNKLHTEVFGFIDFIPPELDIARKVDYELMFYKTFKKPMEKLTDTIGWTLEPKVTLNMLFGASMYQDEVFNMPEYDYEVDEEKDLHNMVDFDSMFHIDYDALGYAVGE